MKGHLIVCIFIYISLMTNDVEHLFLCLLAIYIFFGKNIYSNILSFLKNGLFVFLLLSCAWGNNFKFEKLFKHRDIHHSIIYNSEKIEMTLMSNSGGYKNSLSPQGAFSSVNKAHKKIIIISLVIPMFMVCVHRVSKKLRRGVGRVSEACGKCMQSRRIALI